MIHPLTPDDPATRADNFLSAMSSLGHDETVALVLSALSDPDDYIRVCALVEGKEFIGDSRIRDRFTALALSDNNPAI